MYSAYAFQLPVCDICNKSIPLETSKADESGHAIHEGCYLLKLRLLDATSTSFEESSFSFDPNLRRCGRLSV
jgi:hypothetical protein